MPDHPTAPTDVSEETSWFDQIADRTTHIVAKPGFVRSDVDHNHVGQLNAAVGLEERESSTR